MIAPCKVRLVQIPKPEGTIQAKYLGFHIPSDCPSCLKGLCSKRHPVSWVTLKFPLMTVWCVPGAPGHVGGFSTSLFSLAFCDFIYFRPLMEAVSLVSLSCQLSSPYEVVTLFPLRFTFSCCPEALLKDVWLTLSYLIQDTSSWVSYPSLPPSLSPVCLPSLPFLFLFPLYWQYFLKAASCHRRFAQC